MSFGFVQGNRGSSLCNPMPFLHALQVWEVRLVEIPDSLEEVELLDAVLAFFDRVLMKARLAHKCVRVWKCGRWDGRCAVARVDERRQ